MKQPLVNYLRTLAIALALWTTSTAGAQTLNFRFKSQEAARLYTKANRKATTEEGWRLADSLRRMSVAQQDVYGELMALSVMCRNKFETAKDVDELSKTVEEMMEKGKKSGYLNFYYSGVSYILTFKSNRRDFEGTFEFANKHLAEAIKKQQYYGMAVCHHSLGNIYWLQMRAAEAINEYEQSIECFNRSPQKYNRSFSVAFKMIADSYMMTGQFDLLLEHADKTMKRVKEEEQVFNGMLGYKSFALFMMERDADFSQVYQEFCSHKKERFEMQPDMLPCLETMKLILDGKDDEAQQMIDRLPNNYYMDFVAINFYKRRKRYKEAFDRMRSLNISMYGPPSTSHLTSLHYSRAKLDNYLEDFERQKAEYANKQLALVQSRLSLKQSDLELNQARDREQLALMSVENQRLVIGNQQMVNRQLKDSINNQQRQQAIKKKKDTEENIVILVFTILILLLCVVAYVMLRHNKTLSRRLRLTNSHLQDRLAELSAANEEAQWADKRKTKFLRDMSHEIRTPLNAIVGFTQVMTELKDIITEEEKESIIKEVTLNSETLARLVNNILDLTNIETGRYVMQKDTMTVNSLCQEAIEKVRYMKAKGVEIRFTGNMADTDTIMGDRKRITEVVGHMLSNAAKNTEKGFIELDASLDHKTGMVSFTVTDTGIGIPKELQQKVFERFLKLDNFKQGMGLGLEICRTIATKMEGSFAIDSQYNKGARFIFTFPANS